MIFQQLNSLARLRDDMNRLFSAADGDGWNFSWATPGSGQPPLNVWGTDDALVVEAEVPGVKSAQLDISVVENELTLKFDRPAVETDGVTYHRRERRTGSFTRVIRLPIPVDGDRVAAELRDGVLTITLPKTAGAKPRKIEVAAAR